MGSTAGLLEQLPKPGDLGLGSPPGFGLPFGPLSLPRHLLLSRLERRLLFLARQQRLPGAGVHQDDAVTFRGYGEPEARLLGKEASLRVRSNQPVTASGIQAVALQMETESVLAPRGIEE